MQGGREATKGAVCPALSAGKTENHDRREPFRETKLARNRIVKQQSLAKME